MSLSVKYRSTHLFLRWRQGRHYMGWLGKGCDSIISDSNTNAEEILNQFCHWTKANMNKQKTKTLGLRN